MKLTYIIVGAVCLSAASLFGDPGSVESVTRSAHLAGEARAGYLAEVRGRMVINDTPRGPFGLAQDPGASSVFGSIDIGEPEEPPALLQHVVERIKVKVVVPGQQSFYANGRWFRQGEEFPLLDGDREIPVRVESVELNELRFRNLKTQEAAKITLEILPRALPGVHDADVVLPKGVEPTPRNGGRGAPFRP